MSILLFRLKSRPIAARISGTFAKMTGPFLMVSFGAVRARSCPAQGMRVLGGGGQPVIMLGRHQYELASAMPRNLDGLQPSLMLGLAASFTSSNRSSGIVSRRPALVVSLR